MKPTPQQVEKVAYERWERRGKVHGWDQQDWFAAEGQLRFALNYEVVAVDRLDGARRRNPGEPSRRRCRFCGMSRPRVEFSPPVPALPEWLGSSSLLAYDQCDDCRDLFGEGIDAALESFALDLIDSEETGPRSIPIGAFKGLTRLALGLMPAGDLESYEDAVEWISNPDHDFDRNAFRGLSCTRHQVGSSFPASWAVLARRRDEDGSLPYALFFLGFADTILQIVVPLGQRDEDLDGQEADRFELAPPALFGIAHEPTGKDSLTIRTAYAAVPVGC